MTLRVVGSSMSRVEDTSRSTEKLLQEVAALCAVNQISEKDAIDIFSAAFKSAQSKYAPSESRQPEIFCAAQALSEWHQNPNFLSSDGSPRPLSLEDDEFSTLCQSTRTITDPSHILDLLLHAGAVKKVNHTYVAMRREIIIGDSHPAATARAIKLAAAFLSTLKNNLTRNVREAPRFERTVMTPFFSERHIPSLLAYLSVHGQALLEDIDTWMESRTSDQDGTEVGVGIFFFRSDAKA